MHCIVNKLATVGHDSCLGDFITITPGVNLGGNNTIASGCEFGMNSATIQGIGIGGGAIIGAGAVVIDDLPAECPAVGVSAKPINFLSGR